MLRLVLSACLAIALLTSTQSSSALAALPKPKKDGVVQVEINRASQKMNVFVGGKLKHTWKVSTGRKGFKTPKGAWRPTWMTKMWHSKQWHNAPMPHSVFFKEGYAIHATNDTRYLGRPASHGCVRLAPKNAARLFGLIKTHGEKKTKIIVS